MICRLSEIILAYLKLNEFQYIEYIYIELYLRYALLEFVGICFVGIWLLVDGVFFLFPWCSVNFV